MTNKRLFHIFHISFNLCILPDLDQDRIFDNHMIYYGSKLFNNVGVGGGSYIGILKIKIHHWC